ncbi:MAG: class I SAM-dependent methyltransferase [Chitinophagaceae bacterium]
MKKKYTGERLETFIEDEVMIEHLHRYAFVYEFCSNKIVLDIASGEGYGSNLISGIANKVIGVDISDTAIKDAQKKYNKQNLEFKRGSADNIPCDSEYFDVVVSFETLEHHDKHEEMMIEVKRVLKPNGVLIISTPDKYFYTDKTGQKNPFHVKELYKNEFKDLILRYFKNADFYSQRSLFSSSILPLDKVEAGKDVVEYIGSYNKIEKTLEYEAPYMIAIASDRDIVLQPKSHFIDAQLTRKMVLDAIEKVRGSRSYRIGRVVLKPVSLLKKIFGK